MIDREKLYGFSGRSRKPQMTLAKEFGLRDEPRPLQEAVFSQNQTTRIA